MPNYYDDTDEMDDSSSPSKAESDEMDSKPKDNKDENENTALLSKSFFKNGDKLEVGDVEKVKILHLYEDEVLVKCIYKKGDSEDKPEDDLESDRGDEMNNSMKTLEESMS